jgi:hypothetical protein
MNKWYWRDGTLAVNMSQPDWIEKMDLLEEKFRDFDYKVVKQEALSDGKWISTVWLGLDHRMLESGKPLIFETMVFSKWGDYGELDMERYSTESEALAGHKRMVKKWEALSTPPTGKKERIEI